MAASSKTSFSRIGSMEEEERPDNNKDKSHGSLQSSDAALKSSSKLLNRCFKMAVTETLIECLLHALKQTNHVSTIARYHIHLHLGSSHIHTLHRERSQVFV